MKDTLRAGVQVVTAPDLFPTPADVARELVEAADVRPGQRVLEPSAGTGRLIDAAALGAWEWSGECVAVEVSAALASGLRAKYRPECVTVRCADFLACDGDLGTFDRVLMNPPFSRSEGIKHILHARAFLKPGGRLVALCANGPRERFALRDSGVASEWRDLPAGSFAEAGTNVNVALVVIDAPQEDR